MGGVVILASAFIFIRFGGEVAWVIVPVGSRDFALGLGFFSGYMNLRAPAKVSLRCFTSCTLST